MAALGAQTIASSYEQLLHTDTDGGGNGNTLVTIKDGDNGTTFGIKLATNKVEIIPGSNDANAFEVSQADGTAVLTVNTSTVGATITGDLSLTSATTNKPHLTITNTNADGSAPQFIMKKNPSDDSSADNDEVGRIYMYGDDDAGNPFESILIRGITTDVSNGSEDSRLEFLTYKAGAQVSTLALDSGAVGIGTLAPETLLHVDAGSSGSAGITIGDQEGTEDSALFLLSGSSVRGFKIATRHAINGLEITPSTGDGNTTFSTPAVVITDDTSRVGIGINAPATALHVQSASNSVITWMSTDGSNTKTMHLAQDATRAYLGSSDTSVIQSWTPAGLVGIGTASPAAKFHVKSPSTRGTGTGIALERTGGSNLVCDLYETSGGQGELILRDVATTNVHLSANTATDSFILGDLGVGTTGPHVKLHVVDDPGDNGTLCYLQNTHSTVDDNDGILRLAFSGDADATDGHFIEFRDGNTDDNLTGTISCSSGTATNNTVSDYRTKENISLITGGLEKINNLKPSYFNYTRFPDKVHQGFIAHEVQEAGIGYAVRGEKDAVKDNGDIKIQQFAVANIIPQMVSAIQELSAKVKALEDA